MPRLSPPYSQIIQDDLASIMARCDAATQGPWEALTEKGVPAAWLNAALPDDDKPIGLLDYRDGPTNMANAEFIAKARTDLPRMLEEVITLRKRVQELLEANNLEVNRRIAAENARDEALAAISRLEQEPDPKASLA